MAPLASAALLSCVLIFLVARAAAATTSNVLVEAHCNNALRIRIAPPGETVVRGTIGALSESCGRGAQSVQAGPGEVSNGNVKAMVTAKMLTVIRVSDGLKLLSGPLPTFGTASCGASFHTINASFTTPAGNKWYGLGQLGASDASGSQRNCADSPTPKKPCVVALDRETLGPVSMTSVKFWIAIPWLYNRAGWGVFLNQPGDGVIDAGSAGLAASFTCQKQVDMWVSAAPASATSAAAAVYNSYAHATGMPSPLLENAALYWQSRDAYKDTAEVVSIAKNFSSRNLSLGVLVIDLGPPNDPPYYRLDPARFPDIPAMAMQVKDLTGAMLMPNLKPTSVTSLDCPACGAGHKTDGKADDGRIDASSSSCRACVWQKRIKPALFDKGIHSFWLDDDEANKFHPSGAPNCKPTAKNGAACTSSSCCVSGKCDPNTEKCVPKLALAVAENCSATVGDAGSGQPPVGPGVRYGATQQECCANCSALSTCRTWVYATEHHKAGTCWLLASAGTLLRKSDRISGGDLTPHAPQPTDELSCGPTEYCGMASAGTRWPQVFADGIASAGGPGATKPLILSRNAWAGAAAHGVALWSSYVQQPSFAFHKTSRSAKC
jgi:alpha-glucosidase (family GH31 glycosyl hydrolase)